MAIGTPKQLGTATGVIASVPFTTAVNDAPVGSLVVMTTAYTTITSTLVSVTDNSVGGPNTWTVIDNTTITGLGLAIAYCNVTHDIAVGKTITLTYAAAPGNAAITGTVVPTGIVTTSPLDTSNHTSNGTSATSAASVSTGVLAQAVEIVFGVTSHSSNAGSYTAGGGFTGFIQVGSSPDSVLSYKIVAATTSVPWAPSWGNATNYISDVVSFKGIVSAGGGSGGMMGLYP